MQAVDAVVAAAAAAGADHSPRRTMPLAGMSVCSTPLIYVSAGIIPLLPASTIHRGTLMFANGNTSTGTLLLRQAIATGGPRRRPG